MRRYVLVGSGVASFSAAEAIRSQDPAGEITLIGDESHGFYSRPGLAYYLTGELDEPQLFPFQQEDYQRLNLRWINSRVEGIDPQEHTVTLLNGASMPYDRLLLAVGASARSLRAPGSDLPEVVKLDNLDDARRILKLAPRGKPAVVVGGGITALELVEGLASRGVKVHYFLRGDRYWSNVLDDTESRIVEHRLQEEGVKVHFDTELEAILGRRGRVDAVQTKDGRRIACKLVAYAIGILPRTGLARAAGLKVDRGILANPCMQSSDPDIFVAGDVAEVYDPLTGQTAIDSLWGPAREQGRVAGRNMTGADTPYSRAVPFNVTRLADLTTTIIGTVGRGRDQDLLGIARGDSETWRRLPDAIAAQADFNVNRLRVMVGERTILGAIVMGDQTLSQPLYHLVRDQVDIRSIRSRLLEPAAPLGDILADFWSEMRRSRAVR